MKWFDKWFKRKCKQAWDSENKIECEQDITLGSSSSSPRTFEANGMNFTMYRANGGFVVEYRAYDHKKDRNYNGLHIITSDQDLGESLSQILTLESLKR